VTSRGARAIHGGVRALICVLCLLAFAATARAGGRAGAPPGPPPAVRGVKDGPPPAYVATPRGSTWLSFSSYCWRSTCADFIPASCADKGTPKLYLRRGEVIHFHLGFRPKAVWIGFKRSTAQSLPAARTTTWRVRRRGFFSLGARVTVGGSNFSASYNGCIRLR
jgi:hypothetical protein